MTAAFNLAQLANNLNTSGQLDATDGLTGLVANANLASSGTPNSTTFLRGDRTWAALSQKVLQIANVENASYISSTNNIPRDSSIPQITEGVQILQLNITPQSSSSYLFFICEFHIQEASNLGDNGIAALFKVGTSDAQAVWYQPLTSGGGGENMPSAPGIAMIQNNSTSAQSWTVRFGVNTGTMVTLGGTNYYTAGDYGSLLKNRLTCFEVVI